MCVCVYLCTYVYENELCDPPVIDLVGISYLYDELNLKKKKKFRFVTFVLCRRPMLDFSGYYYYLRSYEIVPIKMLLMFLLFFFKKKFIIIIVEWKLQCDDSLINSFWYGLFNIFNSDLAL